MKTTHSKKALLKEPKPLTFGELVAATYGACDDQAARKILQLAVNSKIVVFKRRQHYSIV